MQGQFRMLREGCIVLVTCFVSSYSGCRCEHRSQLTTASVGWCCRSPLGPLGCSQGAAPFKGEMTKQDDKQAWQDYIDDEALSSCKPGPNYIQFDRLSTAATAQHDDFVVRATPGMHVQGCNHDGDMRLKCAGQMVYSAGTGLSRGAVFEFSITVWDPTKQQHTQLTASDWQFIHQQAGPCRRHVHIANGKLLASIAVEKYGTCKNGWQYGALKDAWNWGTICEWYVPEDDLNHLDMSYLASHCVEATVNIIGQMQRHLYSLKDKNGTMALTVGAEGEAGTPTKAGTKAPWSEVWFTPVEPVGCNLAKVLLSCQSASAVVKSGGSCKCSSHDTMLHSMQHSAGQLAQAVQSSYAAVKSMVVQQAAAVTRKTVKKGVQKAAVAVGAVGVGVVCCPCIVVGHAAHQIRYQPDFGE